MNKDYFQDITPPEEEAPRMRKEVKEVEETIEDTHHVPERSIRNVNVVRKSAPDRREVPPVGGGLPIRRVGMRSYWLWIIAAIVILLIAGLSVFMFRKTVITIAPRAHTIVFDATKTLIAYPSTSAATGTMTYSVSTFDFEDSSVVSSQGTTHAEHKSSGSIVLVNEYSAAPVNLVKNTRFSTPEGLIFRTPADVKIPAMNGKNPGTISVTVIAEENGSKYNVGPFSKIILPGLKGGAMFSKVYARSTQAFSGGFSGDEPAVAQSTRDAAVSEIRGHLQDTIQKNIQKIGETSIVFANFARLTYSEDILTPEGQGQVRITEKVHVEVPVIDKKTFLREVASSVSTDTENENLSLVPKTNYAAQFMDESVTQEGSFTSPLHFSISGTADLIWNVNTSALAAALAGKNQKSFETVVNGFPGIEEAHARIEPFWSSTFPKDPTKIEVTLLPAKNSK